jgi:hypothetical protein
MYNNKNLLRHVGNLYQFGRAVARNDLWIEGQLEFYQIGDTPASIAHAKKPIFESAEDLDRIELLKSIN